MYPGGRAVRSGGVSDSPGNRSAAEMNLRLLAERFVDPAKQLEKHLRYRRRDSESSSRITLSRVGTNEWAVAYQDASGRSWLHPPPTPGQSARRAFENIQFPQRGLVVLWDFGLGYIFDILQDFLFHREWETRVILCEEQFDLVWESINLREWSHILTDPRVYVLFGNDAADRLTEMLETYQSLLANGFTLVPGRNLLSTERRNLTALVNRIKHLKENATPPQIPAANFNHWVIASGSLNEVAEALNAEANSLGMTMTVAERPSALKEFLTSPDAWLETCGGITPGYHIAAYSSLFSTEELRSMRKAGTRRILWLLDHPRPNRTLEESKKCYDLVLGVEPSHAKILSDMGFQHTGHLNFATGFSHWDPSSSPPPQTIGSPDVAYVGSTGLRHHLPNLTRHPQETEILRSKVRSTVQEWGGGDIHRLQEHLHTLAHEYAGAWGEKGEQVTFALATVEIRLMYLRRAKPFGLTIYGDTYWGNPEYSGELTSCFAGRSLDYATETPHLYRNAKINLCVLKPNFVEMIPLRMFDTMACGGFLLAEHRPVFEKYFEPGLHLDLFRNPDELQEKLSYYLSHDDRRREIARQGREKVLAEHTFGSRLRQIMNWFEES